MDRPIIGTDGKWRIRRRSDGKYWTGLEDELEWSEKRFKSFTSMAKLGTILAALPGGLVENVYLIERV